MRIRRSMSLKRRSMQGRGRRAARAYSLRRRSGNCARHEHACTAPPTQDRVQRRHERPRQRRLGAERRFELCELSGSARPLMGAPSVTGPFSASCPAVRRRSFTAFRTADSARVRFSSTAACCTGRTGNAARRRRGTVFALKTDGTELWTYDCSGGQDGADGNGGHSLSWASFRTEHWWRQQDAGTVEAMRLWQSA